MNKIMLIGNLVRDPEMNETNGGTVYCKFTIATSRKYANADGERETDFTNVVAWKKLAELCGEYLAKGRKVAVVGELRTRSYEADDGSKRYITEVLADEVEFLSPKDKDEKPKGRPEMTPCDDQDLPF